MKNNGCNLKRKTHLLRKRICILVQCLILGAFLSSLLFSMYQGEYKNIYVSIPKASTTHSPISIDGNAALDTFCAGKGTDGLSWDTAHVIEDLEIDAEGVGSGIDIRNTNRFLIIRRCTIINSGNVFVLYTESGDSGIFLGSVKNAKITECDVNNNHLGICLTDANYNIISDNVISNNRYKGIGTWNASHNTISGNIVSNDGEVIGISLLGYSNYNTISGNTVSNNLGVGVGIYTRMADHNTISDNEATYNSMGISLQYPSNYNTVSGNNASYNDLYGIKLEYSSENTLSGNCASYNGVYGINLDSDSDNNEVYQNIVCHNELVNINDLGENNDIHDNDDCSQPEGIPSYPIAWISAIVLCDVAISIYIAQKRGKK